MPDITDDARPDRDESEEVFGEAIHWLTPRSASEPRKARVAPVPPVDASTDAPEVEDAKPEPEAEPEPAVAEPAVEVAEPAVDEEPSGAEAAAAAAPAAAAPEKLAPTRSEAVRAARVRRRRMLAAGAAAALLLLVVVGVVAESGGGDDGNTKIEAAHGASTAGSVATTTVPPAPTTVLSADGSESTSAAGTTVTVSADVLFDSGASNLAPDASSRLARVLALAQSDAKRHLLIEGYTDSDGDPSTNQQLSEARAQSVAKWLTGQGIDASRISVVGHGADNPIAANDTPENKALNRRVVVTLQTAT